MPRNDTTYEEAPSCPIRPTRRQFFKWAGWLGIGAVAGTWAIAAGRFFFPRVLFEASQVFKASFPHEYILGEVNTRYQESHNVWIVRAEEGFYALLAKCTHLGCTPVWDKDKQKFKCPCHGTAFTKDGINYEGPAPRPLERVKITLADDGQILIDKRVRFRQERGEWGKPGSILKV